MNIIQEKMASLMLRPSVPYNTWVAHNCPACIHNGQSRPDTRNRGAQRHGVDGSFVFHCFNCGFVTGWRMGSHLGKKMRELVTYYGGTQQDVLQMMCYAKELVDSGEYENQNEPTYINPVVVTHDLPPNCMPIINWFMHFAECDSMPDDFVRVCKELSNRNPILINLPFYWTPNTDNQLNKSAILPYLMNGSPVGYTARYMYGTGTMRYQNKFPSNILYGFDLLNSDTKDIYVFEGPIDAEVCNGVALNGYIMADAHIDALTRCKEMGKRIIVVPDRDKDGRRLARQAIMCGFDVACPEWGIDDNREIIKDAEQASRKYGRVLTNYILQNSVYSGNYAKLMLQKWF